MGTNGTLSNPGIRIMIIALIGFVAVSIVIIVLGNVPTPPDLAGLPTGEWEALEAEQTELLSSYGWIDEEAGIVHIPIEQAIDLQLEQGYPVSEEAVGLQSSR